MRNILLLSPHPDDVELGCGGTISRLVDEGNNIYVAVFSTCKESLANGFYEKDILNENLNSLQELGVKKDNIYYFDYKVRNFFHERQNILEDIILLKNKIKPEIVFTPSTNDFHQDHKVICLESIRAFKGYCTIYGYQLFWNLFKVDNNFIYEINDDHLNKKLLSIKKYKSQNKKSYFNPEYTKATCLFFGINSEYKYAESFEVIYKKMRL